MPGQSIGQVLGNKRLVIFKQEARGLYVRLKLVGLRESLAPQAVLLEQAGGWGERYIAGVGK